MIRYEKDPVNGRFYEVKEQCFTDEQWNTIQQFDAHRKAPKYTAADKITFWFCGVVMFYLICQVLRGAF